MSSGVGDISGILSASPPKQYRGGSVRCVLHTAAASQFATPLIHSLAHPPRSPHPPKAGDSGGQRVLCLRQLFRLLWALPHQAPRVGQHGPGSCLVVAAGDVEVS